MRRQVIIGDRVFSSYREAGEYWGCSYTKIYKSVKEGYFYEIVKTPCRLGERILPKKTTKSPKKSRRLHPVMIDGVAYESIASAARACGLLCNSLKKALDLGQSKFKGHWIVDGKIDTE